MILQLILVGFCAYGYYNWTKPQKSGQTSNQQKKITTLTNTQRLLLVGGILAFVGTWGSMMIFAKPDLLRTIFPEDYSHFVLGYFDAFILIVAISGMFLRTRKKFENWFVFMSSDTIGIVLYLTTGAYFVVMMCSIYWLLDIKGIVSWSKEMKKQ